MPGMSSAVGVRRLSASEAGTAARLFALYREFYGKPFDLDVAEQFLRERIGRDESVVLVAELDGQAVGFTQLYPGFSSVSAAPAWVLNDLYVLASARGRGVADALLEQAEAVAREAGAVALSLQTARDNHVAQRVYERQGYTTDATFVSYTKRLD
jgi:ribosomal protein S18 acetylase RimI-like enzyme